jgi:dinuclear metal center YbgI/SA1388 family protein
MTTATPTVGDIMRLLENIAPGKLAEDWDNPGLQVGSGNWPVKKIWVSLDPLPEVVDAACADGADLLVTHHPLIFRPLHRVDAATPVGAMVEAALAAKMAIVAAHTNLDAARGGLNDLLAEQIGMTGLVSLTPPGQSHRLKLVVFVPPEAERDIVRVLSQTRAGRIGRYSGCSFRSRGLGSFRAEEGARPSAGAVGETVQVEEVRIETLIRENDLGEVIHRLRAAHPYEEMAYDIYPLAPEPGALGIGRVGKVSEPCRIADLARRVKEKLALPFIRVVGNLEMNVETVAVCTGSGSSLIKAFMTSGADVFVSGDLRYHDARDAEMAGKGLLDIGHFGSEHLMIEAMAEAMRQLLVAEGLSATVEACRMEKEPFQLV